MKVTENWMPESAFHLIYFKQNIFQQLVFLPLLHEENIIYMRNSIPLNGNNIKNLGFLWIIDWISIFIRKKWKIHLFSK